VRAVRFSVTARDQLRELLASGVPRFGPKVVAEKRDRLYNTVDHVLARFPATKRPHPTLGLVVYPISDTPFLLLYDFDDAELRVHFVLLKGVGTRLENLDPASVEW
jgi:plasmid stabilization system protein ParE